MTTPSPRDSVIRKIRALRERTAANGCTEAEAEVALAKMHELISEYNVTQDEISVRRDAAGCVADSITVLNAKDAPLWYSAAGAISTYAKVRAWYTSGIESTLDFLPPSPFYRIYFYGFPQDVATAISMCEVISDACYYMSTNYGASLHRAGRKDAIRQYGAGLCARLAERIREMARSVPTGTGLIVLKDQLVTDEFAKYCREHNMNLGSGKSFTTQRRDHHYSAGHADGDKVNLGTRDFISSK